MHFFSKNLHFWACGILSHPTVFHLNRFLQWWFKSIRFKFLKKFSFRGKRCYDNWETAFFISMAIIVRERNSIIKIIQLINSNYLWRNGDRQRMPKKISHKSIYLFPHHNEEDRSNRVTTNQFFFFFTNIWVLLILKNASFFFKIP